ncbi:MAG: DUF4271 domain-containing protein [Bacteroidales bacterium]|nr:DUF4271 domain-containing protein [Bacteroidales bacterium]
MTFLTFRRKLTLISRALFSQRHFSLLQREGKIIEDRSSIFVLAFDLITITTGLAMFCSTFTPNAVSRLPFIAYIGLILILLIVAYVLKLFINEVYAGLFDRDKERTTINQYKFIFMTDFSVLLFPMLILTHYSGLRAVYYLIAVVFVALFAVWIYRMLKINSMSGHRFHFFLYFCTLEILPWVLFLKVLLNI